MCLIIKNVVSDRIVKSKPQGSCIQINGGDQTSVTGTSWIIRSYLSQLIKAYIPIAHIN